MFGNQHNPTVADLNCSQAVVQQPMLVANNATSLLAMWLWVKNRYPKWNPGKWKHGLEPAVPWWFIFDPYPCIVLMPGFKQQGT